MDQKFGYTKEDKNSIAELITIIEKDFNMLCREIKEAFFPTMLEYPNVLTPK